MAPGRSWRGGGNGQRGAAAVEFAIVAVVFFICLFAIFEFGRLLLVWNQAVQATTMGARLAAVCGPRSPAPAERMNEILPGLAARDVVQIDYISSFNASGTPTTGCQGNRASPCIAVRARLDRNAFVQQFSIPLLTAFVTVPGFETTIPSESLSDKNPMCGSTASQALEATE